MALTTKLTTSNRLRTHVKLKSLRNKTWSAVQLKLDPQKKATTMSNYYTNDLKVNLASTVINLFSHIS
jgi:hypothetical protein